MRSFFKTMLAVMAAITLMVIIPFAVISIFGGIASLFESNSVDENSVLEINLNEPLIESSNEVEFDLMSFKPQKNTKFLDILTAIQTAKTDENIKGISLNVGITNADYAQLKEIRDQLKDFKTSKKFIYAYGEDISQKDYYLASVADSVFIAPLGHIELKGLGAEVTFYKKLLDNIGVKFDIIKHGKYKSAVEPLFKEEMSPESKEQTQVLLDDIWGVVSKEIQESRKIAPEQFKTTVDSLNSYVTGNLKKEKLVDGVIYKDEYISKLKLDEEKKNLVSIGDYCAKNQPDFESDQVAIIYASGEIMSGKDSEGIKDEYIIKRIREVAKDKSIKAAVLRVNSPGGSATASERILRELRLLQKEKPLVVSFSGVAASGGYYIAGAGDAIVASPLTITGSIGVFGAIPNVSGVANKIGITSNTVQTNASSNEVTLGNGSNPQFLTRMTQSVEETYALFLKNVAQNRKKTTQQIDAIAQGRVWSGVKAKEVGLIDQWGGLNDAIKLAASKAKITKYSVTEFPRQKEDIEAFMEKFGGTEEARIENLIQQKLGTNVYKSYKELDYWNSNERIHTRMPYILEVK